MKQVILEELEKHRKVHVFSKVENFAPNILTFGIRGVRGEALFTLLNNMKSIFRQPQLVLQRKMRRLEL